MKSIEIQKGQSINVDHITYFEESENGVRIFAEGTWFDVNIPYTTFKNAVNSGFNKMEKNLEVLAQSAFKPRP